MVDGTKKVYGQAFTLYALSAHYQLTKDPSVLVQANELFEIIVNRCCEPQFGGYVESFADDWSQLRDVRLSEVDKNCPKSMNSHLHVLEALTAFTQIGHHESSRTALKSCIDLFFARILRSDHHLKMFLGLDWSDQSTEESYGHEIEFSWLICKAASALGDPELTKRCEQIAVDIANNLLKVGVDSRGILRECSSHNQGSIWWVQAESLCRIP